MIYTTTATIAATGTAVPLASTPVGMGATYIIIQADFENSADIFVGDDTVTTGTGILLDADESLMLPQMESPTPYNLNNIYINGTAEDFVRILYYRR